MTTQQTQRPSGKRPPEPQKRRRPPQERRRKRPDEENRRRRPDREQRPAAEAGRTAPAPKRRRRAPSVHYTPARPFNRNRFLLRMLTAAALVIAMFFGISIFFRVQNITVSGANRYSVWTVRQASEIQEGENLLGFGKPRAVGRIQAALPYVDQVRIGIKLPDTVNIEIEEVDVVYAVEASDGGWWLMSADGRIVEKTDGTAAGNYTRILGVRIEKPEVNSQAVAQKAAEPSEPAADPEETTQAPEEAAEETTMAQETVAPQAPPPEKVFSPEQRLDAALTILQELENNEILGEMTQVDVTDLSAITMQYGKQYQVEVGDAQRLGYKMRCLREALAQLDSHQSGILDVSFTIWPDMVGYTPG